MESTPTFKKLILGWKSGRNVDGNSPFGDKKLPAQIENENGLICHDGNSHMMTIAKTGAGKHVNTAAPILLTYGGTVIVLDIKRELFHTTARTRRQLGPVYRLAPFDTETDSFNPLDILAFETSTDVLGQFLAELTALQSISIREGEFWLTAAKDLLAALFAVTLAEPAETRNLRFLMNYLFAEDIVYSLALLLDIKGNELPLMAYQSLSTFIQTTENTRSGILATAQAAFKILNSEKILRATDRSSFDIRALQKGEKPITIYLQIPPSYLESHSALIRTWIGALMHVIASRQQNPQIKTLFLIDECAALKSFPYLSTMITLFRGFGVITHTFWQDLSLLKAFYANWETIVNNCTLQLYGVNNYRIAKAIEEITGVPATILESMSANEQLLVMDGKSVICQKLNYLTDALFTGLADPNPFYQNTPEKI
ncbi:type IV secretory system conjugative DNA transfer family protein [Spirosoma panaciterrae]|uniref:type IV secretory system conjugative DNA transfer family protein n=1 Tax=Spirosoma panaciterrae TaxID=496058 RepID=UPI0003740E81|nr:type IV secretory system conjugative DNA transfer family protein [Spirosoma panaciterrae]